MPTEIEVGKRLRARRILFIRTDRIGDLLMNLPAIHLLRQTYPKAWITVMSDAAVSDLLKNHPDIDEVIAISAHLFKTKLGYRFQLLRRIREYNYDLGIVSNPDKWFHALLYFAKVPYRVGHDRKWAFFLNLKATLQKDAKSEHEIHKNLHLAKLVSDKAWDQTINLPVNELEKSALEERLRESDLTGVRFAVVHAGTSNPEKRWPVERFAALCDRVQTDLNLKVILIGGKEEEETSRQVAAKTKIPLIDWTGKVALRLLVALFHHPKVSFLVTSDSGPAHIAWISETPVVAMYAKNVPGSDPARWGPLDPKSQVIFRPMLQITTEEVYAMTKKIWEMN